jgi:Na+/H+ antiporter NhaC
MVKKIRNLIYSLLLLIFIFLVVKYYFSSFNIMNTNKIRSLNSVSSPDFNLSLPLLKNDTNDIIEFKNDVNTYQKKKKKYKFWNLL